MLVKHKALKAKYGQAEIPAAEINATWPAIYLTRLTTKELQAGVIWTEALGRARAGQDVEPETALEGSCPVQAKAAGVQFPQPQPDNPRAVIGGNNPPEDLTPDQVLANRVKKVAANFKDFLVKIGGVIKTKAEADTAGNYSTKFLEFASMARKQHKVEKAPIIEAGRAVDARWLRTAEAAEAASADVIKSVKPWIDAEKVVREEEARKANEIVRQAALKEAQTTGEPVERPAEVKAEPVTFGTSKSIKERTKTTWQVTNSEAYFFYLRKTCPEAFKDVIAAMQKLANAQKSAKVEPRPPGLSEKEVETMR